MATSEDGSTSNVDPRYLASDEMLFVVTNHLSVEIEDDPDGDPEWTRVRLLVDGQDLLTLAAAAGLVAEDWVYPPQRVLDGDHF